MDALNHTYDCISLSFTITHQITSQERGTTSGVYTMFSHTVKKVCVSLLFVLLLYLLFIFLLGIIYILSDPFPNFSSLTIDLIHNDTSSHPLLLSFFPFFSSSASCSRLLSHPSSLFFSSLSLLPFILYCISLAASKVCSVIFQTETNMHTPLPFLPVCMHT